MTAQRDVRRLAMALPEVVEGTDHFGFLVMNGSKPRGFTWVWQERLDPKKPRVPNPKVLVVRVANAGVKELLLASDGEKFFTEPHYKGFPAVLVRLDSVDAEELRELLVDAWTCVAPKALVRAFQAQLPQ